MRCPIGLSPVALLGTDCDKIRAAHERGQMEEPIGCRVAKLTVLSARTQAPVTMRVLVVGLHIVETHPHWTKKRGAMVARGIYDTVPNRLFSIFVSNWSNDPIMLPKNMFVAQSKPASDTFWPKTCEVDEINMT